MRFTGPLLLIIFAQLSFVKETKLPHQGVKTEWLGTIEYRIVRRKQGTAESNVNIAYWKEEAVYETNAQLEGRRNEEGVPLAFVRANAHETKDWGSRGKGVCYRETDNSQAVRGEAYDTTTAFSITLNPRTGEYSILAPTLMVYASGELTVSSRVKGTCNNPYNKDRNQVTKLERYQLSDDAPALMGKGRIDPAKPNEIAGSETEEHDTRQGKKTVTIKWNLHRSSGQ